MVIKDGVKELDPSPSTTLFSFISFHRIGFRLTVSPFPVLLPLPFPYRRSTIFSFIRCSCSPSPFLVRHAVIVSFFVSFGSSSRSGSGFDMSHRYCPSFCICILLSILMCSGYVHSSLFELCNIRAVIDDLFLFFFFSK